MMTAQSTSSLRRIDVISWFYLFQSDCMENRKAVLELKDVPPPPCHTPSSQSFSLPRLSLPSPCLLPPPPPHQLTQDSHRLQQPPSLQKQEVDGPTVSMCTHCSPGGCRLNSSVPLYMIQASRGVPVSVASTVYQSKPNVSYSSSGGEVLDSYKPQVSSSVTTSQPCSSDPYLPHYSGLQHTYPLVALQQSLHPSSLPSASSFPVSLHDSCLGSSGLYTCGGDCSPSARRSQGNALSDHTANTTVTSTAHHFANPMHVHAQCTVSVKGAHNYRECCLKPLNGRISESDQGWPKVPLPPTASIPIPLCNGCGTSSEGFVCMSSTSVSKTGPKYGSHESSGPENIPPVGVFWDIENCSVPSGRSAAAVVQRIRSRFFQGHREAEFICVCDISKENKAVIQELNNCQVTVAHINATAKNAADDKLRQCLRRFAETHTAPATVVLVSSDVNFASELSDLRHRHGFQVILVHGNYTSSALLQHAHTHVTFQEVTANLPIRMTPKVQVDGSSPRKISESSVERGERKAADFQMSTPSAFNKLNLQRSFSPLVLSQSSWSSSPKDSLQPFSGGAEIQVSNLDYRMSRKDLQRILHDTFSRHGQVKSLELSPHTDYQLKATVQMSSLQQAISAVSGLHRYKIGCKRIHVSLITGGCNKSLALFSTEIICILQDAPANCLPLFKFTEIYEKKYSRKLMVNDLYRLPELVAVREQGGSRLVCLLSTSQIRQSPLGSSLSQDCSSSASGSPVVFQELEYHEPVCRDHYAQQDFSEADFDPDSYKIPFVKTSLSTLASEVHSLLQSHEGTLPLLSFPDCYAAQFCPMQLVSESLDGGIPLEHLITCVPSITIVTAQNGFKVIKWIHNKPPAQNSEPWVYHCKSPVGNPQLIQFSREIIDLLRSQPSCLMPISKFIPSYHHHFAKQCRVSDYGFSKLLDLLEAVPHVLQILGMGTKRLLTLTHRAQVKRFTQDLLKLLKFQASKQVAIRDFMQAYHWCFSRDWRVTDYGVCDLKDLLTEIPDTTITITDQASDMVISVPKRERTVEEMERTKQFGKEVVDLLRHQPHCRMLFSKFIPTYHHHFGRQCKLSYYGFTKLMDLFEAIPDILMVLECGEEKLLTLTEVEQIKALAAQLVKLLRAQKSSSLPVSQLLPEYSKTFGYGLRLQDYDANSLLALLHKLCHVVKVVDGSEGREVQLINRKSLRLLTSQLLSLLMSQEEDQVSEGLQVDELSHRYKCVHGSLLNPCEYGFLSLSELLKSLPYLVEDNTDENTQKRTWVRLTRLYQFARHVRALLHTYHYNQIFMTEFQGAYGKFVGRSLEPRFYGHTSTDELLNAIPQVVWIKGHGQKRIIVLKNDMKGKSLPSCSLPNSPRPGGEFTDSGDIASDSELLYLNTHEDLLCGPVPSCLPSPQLHPDPVVPQQNDLIHFEEKSLPRSTSSGQFTAISLFTVFISILSTVILSEFSILKSPPTSTVNSPNRRTSRSRIRLAANFSFTAAP
uniref:Meiosis regulator and mRNA stability factor 1 n=1 Tax=Gouania willdenowi TaxID=441366 RepID=A0A8C5G693_GOUWI